MRSRTLGHVSVSRFAKAKLSFFAMLVLAAVSPQWGQASELERHQLVYSCQEQIAPDQLVIMGGTSAQSISPAQAGAQIDARINNIRALVTAKRGSLVLLDRLRAARNPDPSERKAGDEFLPFLQIQRFEAVFPTNSNIDQLLESLFKLGMDRYGKSVRIDEYSARNFSSLTRYRFSALSSKLEAFVARCRATKLKAICPHANACQQSGYATVTARYLTEEGPRDLALNLTGDALLMRSMETLEPSSAEAITFELQGSVSRSYVSAEQ